MTIEKNIHYINNLYNEILHFKNKIYNIAKMHEDFIFKSKCAFCDSKIEPLILYRVKYPIDTFIKYPNIKASFSVLNNIIKYSASVGYCSNCVNYLLIFTDVICWTKNSVCWYVNSGKIKTAIYIKTDAYTEKLSILKDMFIDYDRAIKLQLLM